MGRIEWAMLLSVLDQSPIPEGATAHDALRNSLDLARLADTLGYHRYWVAEHHGTPALACNSPEVLIGPIAQVTSRLRVGSGGIMLPHYSPFKVAENFHMLANLYPGRIDLGIGRAAGTSRNVTHMLQRDRRQPVPDDFPEQLDELLRYLNSADTLQPELWLLGSSPQSAIWAAELGLPYCFADFINPEGAELSQHYAMAYQPSEQAPKPRAAVAAWVVCASTDEEAHELSLSARMMLTLLHRGQLIPVPSIERARQFLQEESSTFGIPGMRRRFITGSPATVRAALEKLTDDYGAEEVFLVNILHDHQARRRSYQLVAQEFGLQAGRPDEPAVA